jgi:thioredoxin-related protein
VLLTFVFALSLTGQDKIEWLSWEKALEKNSVEKRKIIVDVYTDWCGWCKKMDTSTFQNPVIVDYVKDNFYAVKFNAEKKEDIEFNNKVYKYVSGFGRRGYHELANEIMNGRMSYPTVVFLDENQNVIQPIPGFQDAKTFEMIMIYFAENHYYNIPWQKFTRNFNSKNYPSKTIRPSDVQPQVQTVGSKG